MDNNCEVDVSVEFRDFQLRNSMVVKDGHPEARNDPLAYLIPILNN